MTNNIIKHIPKILTGEELKEKLLYTPLYDENICNADASVRLVELNNIYKLYLF